MQIGFLGWSALMHMPGGGRGALLVLRKVCRLAWTASRSTTCAWPASVARRLPCKASQIFSVRSC